MMLGSVPIFIVLHHLLIAQNRFLSPSRTDIQKERQVEEDLWKELKMQATTRSITRNSGSSRALAKRRKTTSTTGALPTSPQQVGLPTAAAVATNTTKQQQQQPPPMPCTITPENLCQQLLALEAPGDTNNLAKCSCRVMYLTEDHSSWLVLAQNWYKCPSPEAFQAEWSRHPPERHLLKIFGKVCSEKRWSQSWGASYPYSGATNVAKPIEQDSVVARLLETINTIVAKCQEDETVGQAAKKDEQQKHQGPSHKYYNGCLQNWYEPDDTIGRHADDEKAMHQGWPIFSLSWGGTRRFLLRAKADTMEKTEIYLQDGDLLVMGGTTQKTHYHEIPKRRVTMDPPTDQRINFTIRSFTNTDNTNANSP